MHEQLERYARLRAALRALSPSLCFSETEGLDQACTEIRAWIREAGSQGDVAPAGSSLLVRAELALDVLAGALLRHLRTLRLPQLRATLPAHCDAHPDEVQALLDVCLAADGSEPATVEQLDYLVTLLASETVDGRKRVRRDPVELSPTVAARCAAAQITAESRKLARTLTSAREELERGEPLVAVVSAVRRAKRDRRQDLFAPDVLRALVAYNVAVANRLDDLERTERELDFVALRSLERKLDDPPQIEAAAPATEAAQPEPAAPEADRGSAFASTALLSMASALGRRVSSKPAGTGAAEQVASLLDTAKLGKLELDALRDSDPATSCPELQLAAVLGLVGRRVAELRDSLVALGIDPDFAREQWVPEILARLSDAMQRRIAANEFNEARRIADARNRFLAGWGEGATMPQSGDAPLAVPATVPAAAPRPEPHAGRRVARRRAPLYAAALVLAVAWGGWKLAPRSSENVEAYSPDRLAAISPLLASGYRDGLGVGDTFIGTVRDEFAALPVRKREATAAEIARSLSHEGLRQVFLFDGHRRLQLHWDRGQQSFSPASR